jgi:hypothetical protein
MELNVSRNELYSLIKEAVRDVLKEERFSFLLKDVPVVSREEMEDIERVHGKPSRSRQSVFTETVDI